MKPRIFIGSSREAVGVCRSVQAELTDEFDVKVWDQGVFRLSCGALDSLLDTLDSSDAGVFVLRPDDLTTRRGESDPAVRDNVLFELGMFIGRLGRDRTFMLTPAEFSARLPSDLDGLTTAEYDGSRIKREGRQAVGPACTKIREELASLEARVVPEPRSKERLDRAMARMAGDLEWLLGASTAPSGAAHVGWPAIETRIGRAAVHVELGRIEDYPTDDEERSVVALPANEYFDDECVTDTNSSLGAFVRHHFGDRLDEFLGHVHDEIAGLPSQRVSRAERRIDDSYGIGQAILVRALPPAPRMILVSATTERIGIGLRAEPHFLYAVIQSIIKAMNENRLNSLVIPVLGSGHGGMPLVTAVLFNLLALRSFLIEDLGRHIRKVRIVIFEGSAAEVSEAALREVISRVNS